MKNEEIDSYDKYKANIQELVSIYPSYLKKLATLLCIKDENSITQFTKQKIPKLKNPKTIINLFQSKELQQEENSKKKITVLSLVTEIIQYYFACFQPNIICVQTQLQVIRAGNVMTDFFAYMGEKMLQFEEMQEDQLCDNLMKVCVLLVEYCTCLESSFRWLTRKLTQFYYQNKLSGKVLERVYSLFSKASLKDGKMSFLYFDGSATTGLKVQLSQNKWPFQKGMRLSMWIKAYEGKGKLFQISTDEGMQLSIQFQNREIEVQCKEKKSKTKTEISTRKVCQLPLNKIVKVQIVLEPKDFGFFKDSNYQLHIFVEDYLATNVEVHVPKFTTSQYIVQFDLLGSFTGLFYGLILAQRPNTIAPKEPPQNDTEIFACMDSNDDLLCLISPLRAFKGILLNYTSPQNNHICHQAKTLYSCSSSTSPLANAQILLPFLHFCTCVPNPPNNRANFCIKMAIYQYCQELQHELSEATHKTLLFIFYFLELADYPINQAVLKMLQDAGCTELNKYLNYAVLQAKNIRIKTKCNPNPVTKLQLLFHLETQWKKHWNHLQQTSQFWHPPFYTPQNDQPFHAAGYSYDKGRELWDYRLSDLITEDFNHCILEVTFRAPQYAHSTQYQQQYIKKQCTQEYFDENISFSGPYPTYTLQKASKSTLNKLKNKIWGSSTKLLKQRLQTPTKELPPLKQPIIFDCCLISLLSLVVGVVRFDGESLTFASSHNNKRFDHMCIKGWQNEQFILMELRLCDILMIEPRRYNQSMNGLQIMMKDGHHKLLYFYGSNVEKLLSLLEGSITIQINSYERYLCAKEPINWIEKKMSNYHYVLWLNHVAGRSYTDITQYPFVPWVLVGNQVQLDWSSSGSFRDLSKNMGSFGPEERTNHFLDKFTSINETEIFSEYHFGTHYSSSAIICNFLIRVEPFATGARSLQSGKFDVADRVFSSYYGSWVNATYSPTDIRELIPEIYTLPELFLNINNYDFGVTQEKNRICNVQLPKWANKNPYIFCAQLRRSFEKDIVSNKLNNWIDLAFGYKQKGKAAIDAMNIYFPLTYELSINLDKVIDLEERMSMETQIAHFGQNPAQIIGSMPHPSRIKIKQKWQKKLIGDAGDALIQRCSMNQLNVKEKFLFGSVFEDKNSILRMEFLNQNTFLVLRRYQFALFKIFTDKQGYISKQKQVDYSLQTPENRLNYKILPSQFPMAKINESIVVVGGFYAGYIQILWLNEMKYSDRLRLPHESITALESWRKGEEIYLYVGDEVGVLGVYEVSVCEQFIRFGEKWRKKVHLGRINHISIKEEARLFTTAGNDGKVKIFNLYSIYQYRWFANPTNQPVFFAVITISPLFAVIFYSPSNSTIYSYSINGQLLSSISESTNSIHNMSVATASDFSEALIYLNNQREVLIQELPELNRKKKIRLKKDEYKISCFYVSSKLAMVGCQDGTIQIIGDPATF